MLRENRPAVRAANILASVTPDLASASEALQELRSSSFVGHSELLNQAIKRLGSVNANDRKGLAEVQVMVERLNVLEPTLREQDERKSKRCGLSATRK